jgi:hypothetical protein
MYERKKIDKRKTVPAAVITENREKGVIMRISPYWSLNTQQKELTGDKDEM